MFKKKEKEVSDKKTLEEIDSDNDQKKSKSKNRKQSKKESQLDKDIIDVNVFPYNTRNNGCIETSESLTVVLNYSTHDLELLNNTEQEDFEDNIIQFLMSLSFPIKYRTTTSKYDLKSFKEVINNQESTDNPEIEEYRQKLTEKMSLLEKSSDIFIRKNYIIISCYKFQEDPKRTMNELMARLRTVLTGINRADIKYRMLNVNECYQLIFNIFNKNSNVSLSELIENGTFDLYCEGLGSVYNFVGEDDDYDISMKSEERAAEEINNNVQYDAGIFEKERIADADIFSNGTISLQECIRPDCFNEKEDYIYMGPNRLCRMFSIATLPRNLNIGYFDELFNQLGIVDLNVYIENIPDSQVIRRITSKYSKIASNITTKAKKGEIIEYDQQAAANDLDSLRQLIQTNSDRMFYSQILVTVWAKDEKELNTKSTLLQDICARKGMLARVLVNDQKNAFITALPTGKILFRENLRNITTGAGTSLFPVGNTELSHKYGVYYGTNLITESPIVYDNFIGQRGSNELSNPMMFICGKPGSGKSVFMKLKIARSCLMNSLNVVIDPEEEYSGLTKKMGGKYIRLRAGEKSGINPFELEVEENDKGEKYIDLYGKMAEIRQMISSFIRNYRGQPLRGTELTGIEEALKVLYTQQRGITKDPESLYTEDDHKMGKVKKKLPILSDLKDELAKNKETAEVAEMMKLITGDSMMSMFDCESDPAIDITNRLIVFSIKQLDEFSQLFAMTNILTWIWAKYSAWKYKDLIKTVSLDEGWVFVKEERKESVDFLNLLVRRGRKYKLSLVIASQNIDEFLRSENGKTVIQMCATKMLFKQDSKVAGEVANYFGISQSCKRYINNFQKGECLMVTESETVLAKIELFDFEEFALT